MTLPTADQLYLTRALVHYQLHHEPAEPLPHLCGLRTCPALWVHSCVFGKFSAHGTCFLSGRQTLHPHSPLIPLQVVKPGSGFLQPPKPNTEAGCLHIGVVLRGWQWCWVKSWGKADTRAVAGVMVLVPLQAGS